MIRLTYKSSTTIPVEAEGITPDNLAGKTVAEIEKLPVQHGNAQVPLAEFFSVEGDAGDREIVIEGDCGRVKWIGAGMTGGRITIRGSVGMHLGSEMVGGDIQVHGDAGDWVGAEMRGGRIHVHGNAGHLVGAAYRGSRFGMRGGVILVDGNAGNEIGSTMRRGVIAIGGNTGDFTGVSMIAGSVFVFGQPGIRVGAGMKRGTIALFGDSPQLLPTFRYDCTYRPVFMGLYLRQLRACGFAIGGEHLEGCYRRFSGDLVAMGKGEVLLWQKPVV
ncbi:MAG TPA: formylmethanofuran dehydrogenase subunit C [Gemmataceae bacterium]|nr:formylmethanofuran dehydrogenase subunit C [Gemmataceae bacterium]